MLMRYRQCVGRRVRTAIYRQMEMAGLLSFAMSAWTKPTLKDWLRSPPGATGLCCCAARTSLDRFWAAACSLANRTESGNSISRPSGPGSLWRRNRRAAASNGFSSIWIARQSWRLPAAQPPRLETGRGLRLPRAGAPARGLFLRPQGQLCGRRAGALHPSVVDERRANLVSAVAAKPHTDKGPRDREQGQTTMYG